MRIRHSLIHYLLPGLIAFVWIVEGVRRWSVSGGDMFYGGLVVILLCVVDYLSSYLEIRDGMVKARVGLIRRKSLSTPIGNINGCEVKNFLFWNRLKITSGLTVYVFKNMRALDAFSAELNRQCMIKR